MTQKTFLEEIEEFLSREDVDVSETRFGLAVLNDPHLVKELREGRNVTLKTAEKARAFIRAYKPMPKQRANRRKAAA